MQDDERARLLAEGRAAWNRGDFFLAHERWEDLWRSAAGAERRWLQGLIQLAAGLHQLGRGRAGPARRLLERGLDKLGDAPPRLGVVDVAAAAAAAAGLLRGDAFDAERVRLP